MHFISSAKVNGTAAFVSLEFVEKKEKFLFFTFDFDFQSTHFTKSPDVAYFLISSDFDLMSKKSNKEKISYGFVEKVWSNINCVKMI